MAFKWVIFWKKMAKVGELECFAVLNSQSF